MRVHREKALGWTAAVAVAVAVAAGAAGAAKSWAADGPPAGRPPHESVAAAAPAAAPANEASTKATVRVYDVGDLVRGVPDYPLEGEPPAGGPAANASNGGGGAGGGAGGKGGGSPKAGGPGSAPGGDGIFAADGDADDGSDGPHRMAALVRLLTEVVAPDTWRTNGGRVGSIRPYGLTSLVVSQTEANHRAVQAVLDDIRQDDRVGTTVEVQAQWVLLTPEQLVAWRAAERRAADPKVDRKAADDAVRTAAADLLKDDKAVVCRATTVGFNGQTVGLTSGRTATVVKAASPVVGQGAALYDFLTGQEKAGVSFQVTPRYSRELGWVTVDVRSLVSDDKSGGGGGDGDAAGALGAAGAGSPVASDERAGGSAADLAATSAAAPLGARSTAPAVDAAAAMGRRVAAALSRPARLEQRFRTTVRVRPGVPVVVGGMTMEPGKAGSRQLCLVIDARPVESPESPAANKHDARPGEPPARP